MQLPNASLQNSWPAPNNMNPVRRGSEYLIITFALLPVSFLIIGLRIFTRTRLYRRWAIDDSLMIASLLPTITNSIIGLVWESKIGWLHIWDYPTTELNRGLEMILISQLLFTVASALMKLSILMFIHRLLMNSQVLMKSFIHVMIVAILVQAVTCFFLELFQCHTISDYWSISNHPQQCFPEANLAMASGIADTAATPVIFVLFLLSQHRTTMIVLLIALISVVSAGVARTYYLVNAVESWDKLWNFYPVSVAESVQLFAGLICASVPPLEHLLTCSSPQPKVIPGSIMRESKDDSQFFLRPTIYRDLYREQHPELHKSPIPSLSPESKSPSPPPHALSTQNDHLLLYYQSFSEDSQLLSPILEESYESMLSKSTSKTRRYIPSYRSSISSFNVAQPALCHARNKPTNSYNFSHIICVPHLTEKSLNPADPSLTKDTDSESISIHISRDDGSYSNRSTSLIAHSLSASGTHEMSASSNRNPLKLSTFEFERPSDWNRDRESILSRISDWGPLAENYLSDSFSRPDSKSEKT